MEALFIVLGGACAIALLVLYSSFSYGFVLYKFWGWFVLSAFPQLPHITFYQAVGLMFFISLFKNKDLSDMTINGVEIKKKSNWPVELLASWLILFIAWFVHLFI